MSAERSQGSRGGEQGEDRKGLGGAEVREGVRQGGSDGFSGMEQQAGKW